MMGHLLVPLSGIPVALGFSSNGQAKARVNSRLFAKEWIEREAFINTGKQI